MAKKKLTANDLDKTLRDFGFKEGDEIYLSSDETNADESTETNEGGEGEGDGGIEVPKKPPPPQP